MYFWYFTNKETGFNPWFTLDAKPLSKKSAMFQVWHQIDEFVESEEVKGEFDFFIL